MQKVDVVTRVNEEGVKKQWKPLLNEETKSVRYFCIQGSFFPRA